ncbi:MAG: mechanosensitive ion channel [Pseudomonadales bacterium]
MTHSLETTQTLLERLGDLLDTVVITTGDARLTLGQIVLAILAVLVGWFLSRLVEGLVGHRMTRLSMGADAVQLVRRILFYGLMAIVVVTALGILGIPLTAFAFVSGAIAIGVGFGAQNIINNFISGWILMGERPIRIGDFVELGDARGRVEAINNRSTRIRRVDGVHMLVPNSVLLESTVINWTLVDRDIRTSVRVGVAYGSPVRLVRDLMLECMRAHAHVLATPAPQVYFEDFGDNALIFDAFFWTEADAERDVRGLRSDLRFAFEEAFREHGIVVAFPQRDVHLDGTLVLADERRPEH